MFIMKCRVKADEVQSVRFKSGMDYCHNVDCSGNRRERAGGLIFLWKEKIQINIISYSLNHIGGSVIDECENQ